LLRLYTVMDRLDLLAGIVRYKTIVREAVVVVEVVVLVVLVYTPLLSRASIYTIATTQRAKDNWIHRVNTTSLFEHIAARRSL
jgi:hypothetical protein